MALTMQLLNTRRPGLAMFSPTVRLGIVFLSSMFYVFINQVWLAAVLMMIGILVYFFSCRQNKALAIAAVFPGIMLFVYNAILSPANPGQNIFHWWIFNINPTGIERGLVTGMRLVGVMLISFAWLAVTPIPEMYQGLAWITPARPWVLELLRGVQIVKREFIALTQSLIIRGLKWDSPLANIKNLVPLAMAIIPRVADNAQKTTFALQSHQPHRAIAPRHDGVSLQSVTVRYSPRLPDVIHDVSLNVRPGEFVYLTGPDMAGKSSILRLVGGVIPRIMGEFKGSVTVDGLRTHEIPLSTLCSLARYVAPEPFSSIYGLTVGQEILFLTGNEETGRTYLRQMGIEHLWERETTKLSGGQQVRLVLAGALASKAQYLLLDSPMQELDPTGRADFMEAIQALRATTDVTILIADPFWRQLASLIDRVIVLDDGLIRADLTPAEFFSPAWMERCHLITSLEPPIASAPGEVLASLEDVHVKLEGNHILRGISLEIRSGELVAIMGPNGSGKTTAMLTLARAIKPFQGQVFTKGQMSYVFQDAKIQAVADQVQHELALGPNILHWSPDRSKAFVEKGLAWTGLDAETSPLDLHASQARMLEIAACDTDAVVVILDEPTVGLDSVGVRKIMQRVNELLQQGRGVIIITHDEDVARLAHRILVIQDGLLVGKDGK